MLNIFPDLLTYSFFAPTLLRVVVAGVFLYVAYTVYRHRAQAAHTSLPLVGVQPWVTPFAIAVYAAIGAMLLVGYYTQLAAILGAVAAWKEIFWGKRMGALFPFSRMEAVLLFAICVSLLLTGAGALAFDLRL